MKQIKQSMKSFGATWGEFVIRFKWPVLMVSLLLMVLLASGVTKFGFNNDYRVFFSEENPQLKAFDALQAKYTKDDNVYVIIEPQNGKKVFDRDVLLAIEYFVDSSAWLTPYSSRVDALTNYQHTIAVGDDMYVQDLISDIENRTDNDIQRAEQIALKEPILLDRLVNSKGTLTGINIVVKKLDDSEYLFLNTVKQKVIDKLGLHDIDLVAYNKAKEIVGDFRSFETFSNLENIDFRLTFEQFESYQKVDSIFLENSGNEYPYEYTDVKNAKDGAAPEIVQKAFVITPQSLVIYENVENAIAQYVRNEVAKLEQKFPSVKTRLSGVIMLGNAFGEAAAKDLSTLIPGMYVTIIVVLMLLVLFISGIMPGRLGVLKSFFSSVTTTFAVLVVLMLSIMGAVGLVSHLGIKFTSVSISAPTMILTLAVADSIHILISMLHSMKSGMAKRNAIRESLRVNFMPVFITSSTTVVGFLTMNFSDSPPFQDLGNTAAIGVGLAWFLSITALPALLSILPVWVKPKNLLHQNQPKPSTMIRLADLVIANNKPLLWSFSILGGLLIFFASQNELNEQFVEYFDESIDFRNDTDFMSENLTGIYDIGYSISANEEGGINEPSYLKKINDFEQWFKVHPEWKDKIVHINSYGDVAKKVNKSMHGDDQAFYKMPEKREAAAQFLLLYEMSLPFGLDLNNQVNVAKSETRFTLTVKNLSANELKQISADGKKWLDDHEIIGDSNEGISTAIMFANLTQRQIYGMANGGVWAIVLISIVLMLALRSFKYGAISIIPNIIPIAFAFGIWYFLDGRITSGLAVVFSMSIGIVVDDTVHLFSKYLRARREEHATVEDAIRYAFKTVGMAIVTTTIVLTSGFIILGQSAFAMNSGMAKLTALTIVIALIIDLFFLPALLIAFDKKRTVNQK